MKKLVSIIALFATTAMAEPNASLSGTAGYNVNMQKPFYKGGLSLGVPLFKGIALWNWIGGGVTAKDDSWMSVSNGIDLGIKNTTTTLFLNFSNNPEEIMNKSNEWNREIGLKFKIKLM